MPTLFVDVDNTLLYSHRHSITNPKHVVEMLNGKEQSYITQFTYSFLTRERGFSIVPVTTRTLPQYKRLEKLIQEIGCEYSLVCNGAVLLHNMQIDSEWYEETLEIVGADTIEIAAAKEWMIEHCGEASTHSAFGLFVYAKTTSSKDMATKLKKNIDTNKVIVLFDNSKTYCIPKSLNKGSAIKRFSQRFHVADSIAAGDSEFDIPMLNQADIAIIPYELRSCVRNEKAIICPADGLYSDELCKILSSLDSEYIEK